MSDVLYVLGFSELDLQLSDHNAWLRLAGLQSVDHEGIRCWYKAMDRSEFEGPEAERNLASLEWLTPRVLAHDSAVSSLCEDAAFYPSRFGTLFSSETKLFELLDAAQSTLQTYFEHVRHRKEWGIKCFVDWDAAMARPLQESSAGSSSGGMSGAGYLRAKQQQKAREVECRQKVTDCLNAFRRLLSNRFHDCVERSIPQAALNAENTEAASREWIGSFAVLLSPHEAELLQAEVQKRSLALQLGQAEDVQTWFHIELTGPWPAYSFCPSLLPA